jgi:hypothetical protein
MAKRKKKRAAKPAPPKPAAWYRKANASARAADVDYIKESVKLLRKFYKGFDAQSGYNLRTSSIAALDKRKIDRIRERARQLRVEMSAAHTIVRPRTKGERKAVEKHTGAPADAKRKAYVVHVPNDKTTVKIKTKAGQTRVVETTIRSGAESHREYFYFADYRKTQPKTIKAIITLARKMLGDMPEGLYVFVSRDYGYIGAPMPKNQLLLEMERSWLGYDKLPGLDTPYRKDSRGLASSLIGFARVSTTIEGAQKEYTDRITRRIKYQRWKRRDYEAKVQRRRRLLTGRR